MKNFNNKIKNMCIILNCKLKRIKDTKNVVFQYQDYLKGGIYYFSFSGKKSAFIRNDFSLKFISKMGRGSYTSKSKLKTS